MEKVKVFVNFHDAPGQAEKEFVNQVGGKIRFSYHLVPAVAAEIPLAALEALEKNPAVHNVELDGEIQAFDAELDNSWGVKHIRAGEVHAQGQNGAGVKVAVLDSGIDYNHPELNSLYAGGYDFVAGDNDPLDVHGHGTHVAGTIAALDNNQGVVGVAPQVRLYALKVLGDDGRGDWSALIAAVEWCVDNGIQVTNSSLGSYFQPSSTVQVAFDNAYARGIVHIAAAGNDGNMYGTGDSVGYPAKYGSVVAVAAVDSTNNRPTFSSTGPDVEVAAPGVSIYSTMPGGLYAYKSGTSMATPHTTGVAALVIGAGVPDLNGNGKINDEVRQALTSTATDIGTAGRDERFGYGLVNAYAAANNYKGAPNPGVTPSPTFTPTQTPVAALPTNTPTSTPPAATATPTRTPTPASSAVASVQSIQYSSSGGRNQSKNLNVVVRIKDKNGYPISGASIQTRVELNGVLLTSQLITTGGDGSALQSINNAKAGTYRTVIQNVTAPGYQWDGISPDNSYTKN